MFIEIILTSSAYANRMNVHVLNKFMIQYNYSDNSMAFCYYQYAKWLIIVQNFEYKPKQYQKYMTNMYNNIVQAQNELKKMR